MNMPIAYALDPSIPFSTPDNSTYVINPNKICSN